MKIIEIGNDKGYGYRFVAAPEGEIFQSYWGSWMSYWLGSEKKAEFVVRKWTPKGLEWAKLNRIV